MLKQFRTTPALAVSAMMLAFGVTAQGGATRTFVSTTGNDSNTAVKCSPSANCRTFAAALSVTNPGGEIVVLTSGGYGPATISQPVILAAIGVDASISVTTSGGNGLIINTTGNVTLVGLNLHGQATGANGIIVEQVASLRLYDMLIENFTGDGVQFDVSANLAIYDSAMNDNGQAGLGVGNASANAYVHGSSFNNNSYGTLVAGGHVTIADSSAEYNSNTGFFAFSGTMSLFHDRIAFNSFGMSVATGGTLFFADCLNASNGTSYSITGGTMSGTSPGTSLIAPGQTTSGTLSSPVAVQ